MKIDEYISSLRNKKIIISVQNGGIAVNASDEAITPEIIKELTAKKQEILNFFESIKEVKQFESIKPAPINSHYPLSHGQKRLWILHQLSNSTGLYNLPTVIPMVDLDPALIHDTLNSMIVRHEMLRTVFKVVDGEPRQFVQNVDDFKIDIHHSEATSISDYDAILDSELYFHFDLSKSALRTSFIKKYDGSVNFVMTCHHILLDGWSMNILQKEFFEIYKAKSLGVPHNLEPLSIHYKDYTVWQNEMMKNGGFEKAGKYWVNKFSGNVPRLKLPVDMLPEDPSNIGGNNASFEIPKALSNRLSLFSKKNEATLFTVLLGVLKTLFYRYTGQEDITMGTVVSGRDHDSLKEQIGFYVNTLALRSNIKGTHSFHEILQEVKNTTLDAFDHQSYPFDLLVNQVEQDTTLVKNPLFDILLSFHDFYDGEDSPADTTQTKSQTEIVEFEDTHDSKFDLSFTFHRQANGEFDGVIGFNTTLFTRNKIVRMIQHFKNLLDGILKNPDESIANLFYLDTAEIELILNVNRTNKEINFNEGIKHIVEAQAAKSPTAVALLTDDGPITFEALHTKANKFANYLSKTHEIVKGNCVGILMDNTVDRLVVLLSLVKLGAIYVPLDKDFPLERSAYILTDTNAKLLLFGGNITINGEELNANLSMVRFDEVKDNLNEFSSENPIVTIDSEDIFSILYTSGSTGKPKGVLMKNKGLINRMLWFWNHYGFSEKDIIYQKTPFVFDVSIGEIFMPLCYGAKLVLSENENSHQITEKIINHNVTYIHFSPTQLNNFLDAPDNKISEISSLRMVVCSGEELTKSILTKYYKHFKIPVSNLYGPTETSIEVTYHDTNPLDIQNNISRVPIGKPIDNVHIYIMDKNNKLLPIGVQGEIAIGGICLADGYLNSPDKTKQHFVDVANFGKIYKTGDLGMWLEDGSIQFFGRSDNQISINGFRIEPGEIEVIISKHPQIHDVAIIPKRDEFNNWHLIAYYTLEEEKTVELEIIEISTKKVPVVELKPASENEKSKSGATNVYELFQKSFDKNKDKVALMIEGKTWSYGSLEKEVEKFANLLRSEYNVSPGKRVVLIAGRSEKTIVSILAILKTGATYIPIDREYPKARVNYILKDSAADLIIMDEDVDYSINDNSVQVLWNDYAKYDYSNLATIQDEEAASLNDLCYICYTSGSTGKPKGVMIEQSSVIDYIETFASYFELLEKDLVIQQSSISFDTSIEEIFPTLATGGKLLILPDGGRNIEAVIEGINNQKVSILTTTPLVINELNTNIDRLKHFPRVIISGGDELRKSYIDKLESKSSIYNTYGPTEFTVCASFGKISDLDNCNMIGKPISNHEIYLLNDILEEVPQGEIGEMFIVGPGMARGYLNNIEETKKHFVPHPSLDCLMYKTGDIARYNDQGDLEFYGRKDNQVKIKGYRVEPKEIDNTLQKLENVLDSVSVAKKDYENNKHIVTYYKGVNEIDEATILAFLREQLPHYMVPDYLVAVEEFPINANGKIDIKALPIPENLRQNRLFQLELKDMLKQNIPSYMIPSHFILLDKLPLTVSGKIDRKSLENRKIQKSSESIYVAPTNDVELKVQKLWEKVLKLPKISTDTNFFEVGGNSIRATQIMTLTSKELGEDISLKNIYNNPTIFEIARLISGDHQGDGLLLKLTKIKSDRPNIFFVPPILGSSTIFKNLAMKMSADVNVFGFQYRGFDKEEKFDDSIETMAESFAKEILSLNIQNQPLVLVGYSMGAPIAFEIVKILDQLNDTLIAPKLILIDREAHIRRKTLFYLKPTEDLLETEFSHWASEINENDKNRIRDLVFHNNKILANYLLEGKVNNEIIAIEANQNRRPTNMQKWKTFSKGNFTHHYIDATHYGILTEQQEVLAKLIAENI